MKPEAMPQSFSYSSRIDNWEICVWRWSCEKARATVVISHGMAEHARRYDRFANALTTAGFEVFAMDHRAHGQTSGPNGLGDFGDGGWDALVDDIDQLVDIARQRGTGPVVLFGHSMGATAAQQFAPIGSEKIAALILSGSTLRDPGETIEPYNTVFEPARTNYDWLSRDDAEVDKYIDDPMCGFEGQTVRNGMDRSDPRRVDLDRLRNIRPDLPVLLVAGDADPINRNLAGIDYLEARWKEAGLRQIDRQIYEGGRHEMLNEINRIEVTRNLIDWIDQQLR
ncbi:MAG: alpha/beta hydrolase [Gammaproteobacteria bacterium]|nr:alpha/beta hydrolase [Gammaproteobacteria bacterium]